MKPVDFPEQTVVWAKDQPPYLPLPAYTDERETITLWALTWAERLRVLFTGRLWLRQLNFGQPLQPQLSGGGIVRDKQVTLGTRVPLSVAGLKLRLSYWGVRNLVMRGDLAGARDEYGRWFVDREALEEAMRARGLSVPRPT